MAIEEDPGRTVGTGEIEAVTKALRNFSIFLAAEALFENGNIDEPAIFPAHHDEAAAPFGRHAFVPLIIGRIKGQPNRSEEHTSELQSLMRNSYAVFCLTKKKTQIQLISTNPHTTKI